jgi:hypothetical protein
MSGHLSYNAKLPGGRLNPVGGCLFMGVVAALFARNAASWFAALVVAVLIADIYLHAWHLIWRAEVDLDGRARCWTLLRRVEFRVDDVQRIDIGPGHRAYPGLLVPGARLLAFPRFGGDLVSALQRCRADIPVKHRRFALFSISGGGG